MALLNGKYDHLFQEDSDDLTQHDYVTEREQSKEQTESAVDDVKQFDVAPVLHHLTNIPGPATDTDQDQDGLVSLDNGLLKFISDQTYKLRYQVQSKHLATPVEQDQESSDDRSLEALVNIDGKTYASKPAPEIYVREFGPEKETDVKEEYAMEEAYPMEEEYPMIDDEYTQYDQDTDSNYDEYYDDLYESYEDTQDDYQFSEWDEDEDGVLIY